MPSSFQVSVSSMGNKVEDASSENSRLSFTLVRLPVLYTGLEMVVEVFKVFPKLGFVGLIKVVSSSYLSRSIPADKEE